MEALLPREAIKQPIKKSRKLLRSLSRRKSKSFSEFDIIDAKELNRRALSADSIHELGTKLSYHQQQRYEQRTRAFSTGIKRSFRRTVKGVKKMFTTNLNIESNLYKSHSTPNITATTSINVGGKPKMKHLSSTNESMLDEVTLQSNGEYRRRKISWVNKIDNWLEESASPSTTIKRKESANSKLPDRNRKVSWTDSQRKISQNPRNETNKHRDSFIEGLSINPFSLQNNLKNQITLNRDYNRKTSNYEKVINIPEDNASSCKNFLLKDQNGSLRVNNNMPVEMCLTQQSKENTNKTTDIDSTTTTTRTNKMATTATVTTQKKIQLIEETKKCDENNNSIPNKKTLKETVEQRSSNNNDTNGISETCSSKAGVTKNNHEKDNCQEHEETKATSQRITKNESTFSFDDLALNVQENCDCLQRSLTTPRKLSKKIQTKTKTKEKKYLNNKEIQKIIESIVYNKLNEKVFDSQKVTLWCKEISNLARDELKLLTESKKIVATTYIGSKCNDTQVHVSVRCQKNSTTDEFLTVALEGEDMYIWVSLFLADY